MNDGAQSVTAIPAEVSDTQKRPVFGTTPNEEFENLEKMIAKYQPKADMALVRKAYEFATKCHEGQMRKSGEPYITHPLAVAAIVSSLKLDVPSIIAAILHDTVEDTPCTLAGIEENFGAEVAQLVDGLTKIGKIQFRSNQERLAENFRKMILAMAKDLRVILVKLCDRLHNMRTIGCLPVEKQKRIAQETLDIYTPLANRLGIYHIKSELEDLCLRYLKNDIYQEIRRNVAAKKSERQAYIDDVNHILEIELQKYGFKNITVFGRPKHFYSIYKKMVERNLAFEDIHDLFAFRIIVDGIKDCYEALGVVHAMWKPMPGRFKDYIAMPKANLYQSLHTTVIRPNGEPAEIQIRTREMHEICEFGVAAHWSYKERSSNSGPAGMEKFSWLRQIVQYQSELKDANEFMEAVKVDLFDEEIFVFTPKGDVFSLPIGATALDFAFAVHTDVGLKTFGAKVNSRIVPIKKKLESGDIVEILTSPHQRPSKDWMSFVITSKARNKIRSYLRSEQRERSHKIGRDLLQQALEKRDLSLDAVEKSGDTEKLIRAGRESNVDDLMIAVGYGRLQADEIIAKAFPEAKRATSITDQVDQSKINERKTTTDPKRRNRSGILVSGFYDVLVNLGQCCNPLPGEPIVGFITRGKGVTVHTVSCSRALDVDPARRIEVSWSSEPATETFHISHLRIVTQDKPGVLAEVTSAISGCNANVQKAEVRIAKDMTGVLEFELGVKNLAQLETVINKIENIPTVIKVNRVAHLEQKKRNRKRGRNDEE